jgi:diguanylate cyclase (GGDEF)-like protein
MAMKVLLAEDSLTMMITTSKIITNSGHEVIPARDGKEALSLYSSENPDLVLLDIEMPELTGFEVAEKIRADNTNKWIPIIFLTGYADDENLSKGIESGGDDYLIKPVSQIVLNAKLNAMHRISEMQNKLIDLSNELSETNNKLQNSVITDPLTGAKNRLYLDECIKNEWFRGMRDKSELSLLIVDVDNFKTLNDTNGHQAGDTCLIDLVKLFGSHLKRSSDVLCRYGGDEFVVVLPNTSGSDAFKIGEKIRTSVITYNTESKLDIPVAISVSIGCATRIPDDSISFDEFLTYADKALYKAKAAGRNCVVNAEITTNKTIAA